MSRCDERGRTAWLLPPHRHKELLQDTGVPRLCFLCFPFSSRDSSSLTRGPWGLQPPGSQLTSYSGKQGTESSEGTAYQHTSASLGLFLGGIEVFLRDSCMLAAAGTVCDIAARCAVTGREEQQRQGEKFVGIHPPPSMEQGRVQVGTACPGVWVLAGTLEWSSAPLRTGTGGP